MARKQQQSYLYSDGTLVTVFEESRRGQVTGETVDVHYQWCEPIRWRHDTNGNRGRLVLRQYETALPQVFKGKRLEVAPESTENGSENTRRLNIPVGNVIVSDPKNWRRQLTFTTMDSLLSGPLVIQADALPLDRVCVAGDWFDSYARVWRVTGEPPADDIAA